MEDSQKKRVFIVGSSRSGTSLIQAMLGSHPRLTTFTESHFYTEAFFSKPRLPFPPYNFPRLKLPFKIPFSGKTFSRNIEERVKSFCAENEIDVSIIPSSFPEYNFWLPWRLPKVSRKFIEIFDTIAKEKEKEGWVEKTPYHLYYIPLIDYTTQNARFVHIVRDGRENIASLYRVSRQYWSPKPLEVCVRQWNRAISTTNDWVSRGDHSLVVYEELVKKPEKTLRNLCSKLSLSWSPKLLNYQEAASDVISNNEDWKSKVKESLKLEKKFKETFDNQQQNYVKEKARLNDYKALRGL